MSRQIVLSYSFSALLFFDWYYEMVLRAKKYYCMYYCGFVTAKAVSTGKVFLYIFRILYP